jgi:hypothetical protein
MELAFGIMCSAALGYLVTEINEMQAELKQLRKDVIVIQIQLDRRSPKNEE